MSRFIRKYGDVLLAAAMVLLFTFWPGLDLALAERFYVPGEGFPASQVWWVKLVYESVARLWLLAPILTACLAAGWIPPLRERWAPRRRACAYLLVALVIGPGLIVNSGLKNHWGRPRPVHLAQFGGNATFTPPLVPDTQCVTNCAFASGHAAAAFFPMAAFWINRRRRWLAGGIAFGLFVGYIRMAMGAHFLSDVLFAGVIVYFTCKGCAYLFGLFPGDISDKKSASLSKTDAAHMVDG